LKRSLVLWGVAVLVTLFSAGWQKRSGPTYPVSVDEVVGGEALTGELPRSWTVGDPVHIELSSTADLSGEVEWRRWPTGDEWERVAFVKEGDVLVAELPAQTKKAAKIEYRVRVSDGAADELRYSTRLRFKGAVPGAILVVHILAMFLGMLFSLRAGMEAVVKGDGLRWQTIVTLICLGGGGLLLGPIVQRYAFDAYWTGWPVGEDLTDNKLALAVLFWAIALWQQTRGRWVWSVVAAVVTFVIFMVPHSLHGSTHDWETGEHIQAMVQRFWPLA